MGIKGQKVNPVGWRVGFYRKWKTLWYEESWNYGLMLNKTLRINELMQSFLLYKRLPALNCNIMVANQGTEKFIILVYFYNLREEETSQVKKRRKRLRGASRFQSVRILWDFEKKYTRIKKQKRLKIFSALQSSKNEIFFNKKLLEDEKVVTKRVTYKALYFRTFSRRKLRPLKKYTILSNNFLKDSSKMLHQFFFEKKKEQSFFFENYFLFFFQKKINSFDTSTITYLKNYWLLFLQSPLLASFLALKHDEEFLPDFQRANSFNEYDMSLFFYNSFSISQGLSLASLMKIKQQKETIKLLPVFNLENTLPKKKLTLKANYFLKRLTDLSLVLQKKKAKKTAAEIAEETNKKNWRLRRELSLHQKLIGIRELAIQRKFVRLKMLPYKQVWMTHFNPAVFKFNRLSLPTLADAHFRSKILRLYLEKISYHIYYTFPYITLAGIRKSIELSKKRRAEAKKKKKEDLPLKDIVLQNFGKDLHNKIHLSNKKWFFSLQHLHNSLQFILQSKVDIFFINTHSLLRYKTRLIPLDVKGSIRKLGAEYLWRHTKLQKINTNRQYQKVLKNPFLIERRGKRKGPFLRDFVLLILIALLTRNFKVLLKFINYQTKNMSKTKRQIPFIRFLMRLITNLAGSVVRVKGLRIQFKGRFDRWNRTKSLVFTSGNIPLQRKDADIEYGSSHGLVKKGVYGIRLWVWYGRYYHKSYKNLFISYWYFKRN